MSTLQAAWLLVSAGLGLGVAMALDQETTEARAGIGAAVGMVVGGFGLFLGEAVGVFT